MAIISHRDLLSHVGVNEESEWLVEGLIRKASLGICGALPKCGKTWLCLAMAQAVATGTPFLGRFRTHKTRTLFLELEDSPRMLAERSIALIRGNSVPDPEPGFLNFLLECVLIDTPTGMDRLRRALSETQAKFLVVDTLNRAHALNENLQAHATKLITALDNLRRDFQCCVLATHHLSKTAKAGQGGKALRGSSVIHAGLENSLFITRNANNNHISVEVESKFTQVEPFSYLLESGEDSVRLTAGKKPRYVMPSVQEMMKMTRKERADDLKRWEEYHQK